MTRVNGSPSASLTVKVKLALLCKPLTGVKRTNQPLIRETVPLVGLPTVQKGERFTTTQPRVNCRKSTATLVFIRAMPWGSASQFR